MIEVAWQMRVLLNWGLQTEEPVEPAEPIFFVKKNSIRRGRRSDFYDWNLILFLYDSNTILYISVLSFKAKKTNLSITVLIERNIFFLCWVKLFSLTKERMHVLLRVVSSVGLLLSTCFRLKLLDQRLKYVLKYARQFRYFVFEWYGYFSCWDAKNNYQIVFGSSSFWMYQVDYGCYSIGIK